MAAIDARSSAQEGVAVVDMVRTPLRRALRYTLLVIVSIIVLLPIYVTLIGALKPGEELLDYPQSLYPWGLTTEVFRDAWSLGRLDQYLINSAIMSGGIMLGQIVTSVLAAYAFAFLEFPLKRFWFLVFIATLTVPAESIVLGNLLTMQSLGWVDTYQGLIVPFLAFAFGTFLIRQVFMTIPKELREAAALDGVGHLRFLWEVAVPLARPAIGALALFSFLSAWNQYLWPQRVTTDESHRTIQIGLASLRQAEVDRLNLVMAGTIIAAIPIAVLLIVFQRQLVRGLTAGAVKG